jgi:acetyl-CoA carboxylase biotin carboxylase subunit
MRGALDEFRIGPLKTTIPLHRRILDTREFQEADFDIHYVERMLKPEA